MKNIQFPNMTKAQSKAVCEAALPAMRLYCTDRKSYDFYNLPRNTVGGLPLYAASFDWPYWGTTPLTLVAQVDLSQIPNSSNLPAGPREGKLLFFVLKTNENWFINYEVSVPFKVLHVPTSGKSGVGSLLPFNMLEERIVKSCPLEMEPMVTCPDSESDFITSLLPKDDDRYSYGERTFDLTYKDSHYHQLFGHPHALQGGDMAKPAGILPMLIDKIPAGFGRAIEDCFPNVDDWMLLLQLDSVEDAGIYWGDMGVFYFLIGREDFRNGRFDRIWLNHQYF
jgi:hypothetical protein